MKNLFLILICTTFSFAVFATPVKKQSHKLSTPTITETKASQPGYVTPPRHMDNSYSQVRFGANGALGMNDGNFGFGIGFRADVPVQIENALIRVGGETGFNHFSVTGGSYNVFPLAGSAQYNFNLSNSEIAPYGRLAMGIDFVSGIGDTVVKFHFVLEPGIEFSDNRFFAALPIGTLAGGFLLMPIFGIHF